MDIFCLIADRKIEEAMQDGEFDDLEGAGKPLPEDDDACLDPATRMAHRLMKNAGITPDWIAEAREIDRESRRVQKLSGEDRRKSMAALNRRIELYNLKTPVRTAQRLPVAE